MCGPECCPLSPSPPFVFFARLHWSAQYQNDPFRNSCVTRRCLAHQRGRRGVLSAVHVHCSSARSPSAAFHPVPSPPPLCGHSADCPARHPLDHVKHDGRRMSAIGSTGQGTFNNHQGWARAHWNPLRFSSVGRGASCRLSARLLTNGSAVFPPSVSILCTASRPPVAHRCI
jgi:hypothetical protein